MSSIILTGLAMTMQPEAAIQQDQNAAIPVEETGVATTYEATKTISCGNAEWRVKWKSAGRGKVSGDIVVAIASKSQALPEAQSRIFAKFASVDSVSATCNRASGGEAMRSSLLISGHDLANGKKALAQVHVGPDSRVEWSFNTVE